MLLGLLGGGNLDQDMKQFLEGQGISLKCWEQVSEIKFTKIFTNNTCAVDNGT